ncbi:MAG TPA: flagellar biosynthetic protein FliR [Candidatus Dormibacteraeota bacterium]|nr:flagellar biosynthetic protein FliR [Candidatus Dormibacteraeota bacterium]
MTLALLVFARALGFCARAPGLVHPSIPALVRVGLALSLTALLTPSLNAEVKLSSLALVLALGGEFALGSAIGIACGVLYDAAYTAGRLLDDYVGVHAVAPSIALVAPSGFGRLWSLAFTGGFFLLGADRPVIAGFAESLLRVPPGAALEAHGALTLALWYARTIAEAAIEIAAPAIALAFVVQIALAAIARTIPRFINYALAFPLAFGAVTIATALALPVVAMHAALPILPPIFAR